MGSDTVVQIVSGCIKNHSAMEMNKVPHERRL